MRPTALVAASALTVLALVVAAPAARAKGSKAEVLAKIEGLLESGDLDQAKQMIDFFLGKNPGDPDLLVLRDRWRVQQGDMAGLLAAPKDTAETRAACWRIVKATMKGNPEEWEALLHTGDDAQAKALLTAAKESGTPEDQRVAAEVLRGFDPPRPDSNGYPDVPADRLLVALRSADRGQVLWGLHVAEAKRPPEVEPDVKRIFGSSDDPETKYAAAAVLLSLGEYGIRQDLRTALRSDRPVTAVEAGKVLLRYPGDDPKAVETLLAAIEKDDAIGRAKPTLLSLGVMILAKRREPGALEFLEARLAAPDLRIDVARALGVLGDAKAVPVLLDWLKTPPPAREEATSGGLGFLGGSMAGAKAAATAEALRPALVGALAVLRLTAPGKPEK
jgi:hypothetical protein